MITHYFELYNSHHNPIYFTLSSTSKFALEFWSVEQGSPIRWSESFDGDITTLFVTDSFNILIDAFDDDNEFAVCNAFENIGKCLRIRRRQFYFENNVYPTSIQYMYVHHTFYGYILINSDIKNRMFPYQDGLDHFQGIINILGNSRSISFRNSDDINKRTFINLVIYLHQCVSLRCQWGSSC